MASEEDLKRALQLVCNRLQWSEETPSPYVIGWARLIAEEFAAVRLEEGQWWEHRMDVKLAAKRAAKRKAAKFKKLEGKSK
jgi:hypothetical protein